MSDEDIRILPGAFGEIPKTVPVVIYEKDGSRRVIGNATITPREDGFRIDGNITEEQRQKHLEEEIYRRGYLTVTSAWEFGNLIGFYQSGDATKVQEDLKALAKRRSVTYHEGFWRVIGEPDHIRLKHRHWADYWTPRGR